MNIAQRQAAKEMVELLSKHSDIEKSKPNPVSSTPTGSSTAAQNTLSRLKKLAAPIQSTGNTKFTEITTCLFDISHKNMLVCRGRQRNVGSARKLRTVSGIWS